LLVQIAALQVAPEALPQWVPDREPGGGDGGQVVGLRVVEQRRDRVWL
jgi:hypothetical protein